MKEAPSLLEELGIPELDMRVFARRGPCLTRIFLQDDLGYDHSWITTGPIELRENRDGTHTMGSRMVQGATDSEHDSAWAFEVPVVGLKLNQCTQGIFEFQAWLATASSPYETHRIRLPDGNPLDALLGDGDTGEEGEPYMCNECEVEHPVIRFLPDPSPGVSRILEGRKIIIRSGYAWK